MRHYLTSALLVSAFIFCFQSCSQKSDPLSISEAPSELYGTWHFIESEYPEYETLSFSRISPFGCYGWGQTITVNSDGKFEDAYSAMCGNDEKFHRTSGRWGYDDNTKVFQASIPICLKDKRYKIQIVTNDTLVLLKL